MNILSHLINNERNEPHSPAQGIRDSELCAGKTKKSRPKHGHKPCTQTDYASAGSWYTESESLQEYYRMLIKS